MPRKKNSPGPTSTEQADQINNQPAPGPTIEETASKELWDRLEKEPGMWYVYFERYRRMRNRDLNVLYEKEKQRYLYNRGTLQEFPALSGWKTAARNYHWKERVAAFDEWRINQDRKAEQELRFEAATKTSKLLTTFQTKLLEYVNSEQFLINDGVKFSDIIKAIQMVSEQLRIQHEGLPVQVMKMQFGSLSDQELLDYITGNNEE